MSLPPQLVEERESADTLQATTTLADDETSTVVLETEAEIPEGSTVQTTTTLQETETTIPETTIPTPDNTTTPVLGEQEAATVLIDMNRGKVYSSDEEEGGHIFDSFLGSQIN